MDDQATEQTPPTPYARPQQPTDSPAASLPTETLMHILNLAQQDLSLERRQKFRMVFSSVCKHWWSVTPKMTEVVHGSKQAEQLSSALLGEELVFRQEAIRTLIITVGDEITATASRLIGELLLSCPLLKRLDLTIKKGFVGEFASLGKGLRDAIASSDTLVELELRGNIKLGRDSFEHVFGNLPNLRKIVAPSLTVKSYVKFFDWPFSAYTTYPTKLEHLEMPLQASKGGVEALVKSSKRSITTLRVGKSESTPDDLINALLPRAPKLVDVEMLTGNSRRYLIDSYLAPFLKSLASIRRLSIGLCGYDVATLFKLLVDLSSLESFTLSSKAGPDDRLRALKDIKASQVATYLATAHRLQQLTLPEALDSFWTETELESVEQAAERAGVEFQLR